MDGDVLKKQQENYNTSPKETKGDFKNMSEKEIEAQLKEKIYQYESIITENLCDLEKAHMALNELLNEYEWNYEPTAQKALKYGSALSGDIVKSDKEAEFSYKYLNDYKKIIWLISIARDYCHSALESCNNAYYGGVANE